MILVFLNKLSAYSFLKQFEKRKYKVGRYILLEYLETIKTNKKQQKPIDNKLCCGYALGKSVSNLLLPGEGQMHDIEKGNNRCISLTGMFMKKE